MILQRNINSLISFVLKTIQNYSSLTHHEEVKCNYCKQSISSNEIKYYRCTICNNYNLCGKCFEYRRCNSNHKIKHPMVRKNELNEIFSDKSINGFDYSIKKFHELFKNFIHNNSRCNGCGKFPIIGIRFKCDECIDFDLCYDCYLNKINIANHNNNHSLIIVNSISKIYKNDIQLINKLGAGAFGSVYKAKHLPTNKIVACKIIETNYFMNGANSETLIKSYLNEVNAYSELNSNNIVKMYGHFIEANLNSTKYYLIMEYMEKGSLGDLIKNEPNITYRCKLQMAINIISGMRRIHEKGFIHRDIRPDNILVSKNYIAKIGDMGIAKFLDNFNKQQTIIGCLEYMPQEFYTGQYAEKLDIFTYGLTIYNLFSGKRHLFQNYQIKIIEKSPVFQYLIDKCLYDDPDMRPFAFEIEKILRIHYETLWQLINKTENYSSLNNEQKFKVFVEAHNLVEQEIKNFN